MGPDIVSLLDYILIPFGYNFSTFEIFSPSFSYSINVTVKKKVAHKPTEFESLATCLE